MPIHPLVAGAAISVMVLAGVGVAAITRSSAMRAPPSAATG